MKSLILAVTAILLADAAWAEKTVRELRIGYASHAFDHLGNIGEQADAAVASGNNIIYDTGLGVYGYQGLPNDGDFAAIKEKSADYIKHAKKKGVKLAIGYVCATSIVKLDTFDKYWSPQFRAQFHSAPRDWRQVDSNGNALPSWYGGDYQPACMNNPDWRTYEKFMVRQQLETGHDGIFFDNPTVHPQGCYCEFCMRKFAEFLRNENTAIGNIPDSVPELRKFALNHGPEFLRFRCTTARDFLAEIRAFARTINRHALITCNNSLNSPDVFYSQGRTYGYNINEMTKVEDFVVVEDMNNQPRSLGNGNVIEYGSVYKDLRAISRGKPVVAVTIANGDYHTAPHLVRLAMAEAAANDASYLSWPTWPENVRAKMASEISPEADFLRRNEKYLNETSMRRDALVFLPFRRWQQTTDCRACRISSLLTSLNFQYEVISEDTFLSELNEIDRRRGSRPVLLLESKEVLNANEKAMVETFEKGGGKVLVASPNDSTLAHDLAAAIGKGSFSFQSSNGSKVRVIVHDQKNRTLVHLLNLDIQRISSFEDKVQPAANLAFAVTVPFKKVRHVRALTADGTETSEDLLFTTEKAKDGLTVNVMVPKLEIATLLVIE